MKYIINIAEAVFLFYATWIGIAYYRGKLTLSKEGEIRRKKILRKYRWIIVIASMGCFFGGAYIVVHTLIY
jgi:hypothetical protein